MWRHVGRGALILAVVVAGIVAAVAPGGPLRAGVHAALVLGLLVLTVRRVAALLSGVGASPRDRRVPWGGIVSLAVVIGAGFGEVALSHGHRYGQGEGASQLEARGFRLRKDAADPDARLLTRQSKGKDLRAIRVDVGPWVIAPVRPIAVVSAVLLALLVLVAVSARIAGRGTAEVLLSLGTLACLGLVILYRLGPDLVWSAPRKARVALELLEKQATSVGLALILGVAVFAFARRQGRAALAFFEQRGWVAVCVALALAVVTRVAGARLHGASLALSLGGQAVQMVELVKPFGLLWLVAMVRYPGDDPTASPPSLVQWSRRLGLLGWALVAALACLPGPILTDTGMTATLGLMTAALLATHARKPTLAGALLAVGCAGLVVLRELGVRIVVERVADWLEPFTHSESQSQALWAISSAGWVGSGLGSGLAHTIPNVEVDYVFCLVAEELGLVGAAAVTTLLAVACVRIVRMARSASGASVRGFGVGAGVLLGAPSMLVAAGDAGLMPLTGLPFFGLALGGASFVTLGVIVSFALGLYASSPPEPGGQEVLGEPILPPPVGYRLVAGTLAALAFGVSARVLAVGVISRNTYATEVFRDEGLTALLEGIVDAGQVAPDDDGDGLDLVPDTLDGLLTGLRPELRSRARYEWRVTARLLSPSFIDEAFLHTDEGIRANPDAASRSNPRLASVPSYVVSDRHGVALSEADARGGRRHALRAAGFPVVGHARFGAATGTERVVRRFLAGRNPLFALPANGRSLVRRVQQVLGAGVDPLDQTETHFDVRLTLDARVQREIYELYKKRNLVGAAVALAVPRGEVLALVTAPSVDPDTLEDRDAWSALVADDDGPALNRALRGLYPPGSVFKLVTAAAALDTPGVLAAVSSESCGAKDARLGLSESEGAGHGKLDFPSAMAVSCNLFFGRAGAAAGPALPRWARALGVGSPVRLFAPACQPGPESLGGQAFTCFAAGSAAASEARCGRGGRAEPLPDDFLNRNLHLLATGAIGQGPVLVTPMDMAIVTSTVASGGLRPAPRLVSDLRAVDESGSIAVAGVTCSAEDPVRVLSTEHADEIGMAMRRVMEDGTARRSQCPGRLYRIDEGGRSRWVVRNRPPAKGIAVPVSGKTGTAESAGGKPHSWFVAYAPANAPQVAVAVLVERGGRGAQTACPIAMRALAGSLNGLAEGAPDEGDDDN